MMRNWFRGLRTALVSRRPAPRRSCRFALECLDQRCLPDAGPGFVQTNLVADIPGLAPHTDRDLINPWGFTETPDGQFRVSANGSGTAPIFDARGDILKPDVTLPPPLGSPPGTTTTPDGQVTNTTSDFVISDHGRSAPATNIFSTEDGTIVAWNERVDRTHAVLAADESQTGAVYKLLALGSVGPKNFLYATDFHNNMIDVFDGTYHKVALGTGGFGTFTDPNEPAGFAPFGVKDINGTLFVSYAKQDADKHDDVAAPGNGFIDEFDTSGHLLKRFASGTAAGGTLTQLNSPIGMAVAPDDYGPGGKFSGALLVGNFGDSHVSAFDLHTGAFLGQLSDAHGQPLTLNGGVGGRDTKGLWGIAFGNGRGGAGTDTLFFAAGINDEADGLFGKVTMAGRDHDRDDGHDRDDRHHDGHGHDGESVALGTFVGKGFADSRADDSAARQGHGPSGSDGPGARGAGRDALLTAPPPVQAGADSLTSVVHRRKDQEFDAFDQDALE